MSDRVWVLLNQQNRITPVEFRDKLRELADDLVSEADDVMRLKQ